MPSWLEIVDKGSHPMRPCQAALVVVQDWRSEPACGGFDLEALATAGGVAGRFIPPFNFSNTCNVCIIIVITRQTLVI